MSVLGAGLWESNEAGVCRVGARFAGMGLCASSSVMVCSVPAGGSLRGKVSLEISADGLAFRRSGLRFLILKRPSLLSLCPSHGPLLEGIRIASAVGGSLSPSPSGGMWCRLEIQCQKLCLKAGMFLAWHPPP